MRSVGQAWSRYKLLAVKVELQSVRESSYHLIDGQLPDPFSDVPVLILILGSLAVRLK